MPDTLPVFHVRTSGHKGKVLEKIAAPDMDAAKTEAEKLLGPVDGLFLTGPHEHVEVAEDKASEK